MKHDRTCSRCGLDISGKARSARYCSLRCSKSASEKRRRRARRSTRAEFKACLVCGRDFVVDGNRTKTCSIDCTRAHKKELKRLHKVNNRDYYRNHSREWHAKHRPVNIVAGKQRNDARLERLWKKEHEDDIKALGLAMKKVRDEVLAREGKADCRHCKAVVVVSAFSPSWGWCRACVNAWQRTYNHKNATSRKALRSAWLKKKKDDPIWIALRRIRQRHSKAIRLHGQGVHVGGSKLRFLGCSGKQAAEYLERQFTRKMTWKNYGTYWHIDHVRPLCSFDLSREEEMRIAFHYTNIRPLVAVENIRKGGRITVQQHQPELLLCTI